MRSIKVGRLTDKTKPEDLRRVFERFGDVESVCVPRNSLTGDSLHYGFVQYYSQRNAEVAFAAMKERVMDGRRLQLEMIGGQ